jgi:5-(carboxyamino)imidazole ribonucleotide synthase
MNNQPLLKGSMIGILGGGQLGRMTALAAHKHGYHTKVWALPGADNPATKVASSTMLASYDSKKAFMSFVTSCAVATLEFENIPVELVETIGRHIPMRPGRKVLEVAQDRWLEKCCFRRLGLFVPDTRLVNEENLKDPTFFAGVPFRAGVILKTSRFGYDGKNQKTVSCAKEVEDQWRTWGKSNCVIEQKVDYAREISVIVARNLSGDVVTYEPIENKHEGGILRVSTYPANISPSKAELAKSIAISIAKDLELVGILAVEMFVTKERPALSGPSGFILVNEIAPRPHNSGHGTIEACESSQFDQLVRISAGIPFGPTTMRPFTMVNVIGKPVHALGDIPNPDNKPLFVHDYEKAEVRPGRKMGHYTFLD